MRTSKARFAPLADGELDPEQKQLLEPMTQRGRVLNIFRTFARAPDALKGFLPWGNYILSELHASQFVSDTTWAALGGHFDDKQRMDVVFTVGQYTQVSMILNTFGVQLDEGQTLDPDLKAS